MVVPVAASGLVQILPQRLHIPSHLLDLLVVHHLAEVVFQRVLGEIRQGLVHCVVFLRRGGDADTAGGGVVLVQILEVHTAADAALQQDGGQVGDHINSKVKIHFHTTGVGELQILHSLAEAPVLLVQPNLGEDFAEGDFLFLLVF